MAPATSAQKSSLHWRHPAGAWLIRHLGLASLLSDEMYPRANRKIRKTELKIMDLKATAGFAGGFLFRINVMAAASAKQVPRSSSKP